jgi:phosphoribosylanthranilate isomerase
MSELRIKICGITNPADARQAALLGADAIGLNFYARSPRCVPLDVAARILRELPPLIDPVALFVNQPLNQVFEITNHLGAVRTVQWHGDEPEMCDAFPFRLIVAFQVREQRHVAILSRYLDMCRTLNRLPSAVLVDAQVAGEYGGTGQTVPWKLLMNVRLPVPLILAGGLTPENVTDAIRIVRPYAVDVASGVESSPGKKDSEKMRRFIGTARAAAAKYLGQTD